MLYPATAILVINKNRQQSEMMHAELKPWMQQKDSHSQRRRGREGRTSGVAAATGRRLLQKLRLETPVGVATTIGIYT